MSTIIIFDDTLSHIDNWQGHNIYLNEKIV